MNIQTPYNPDSAAIRRSRAFTLAELQMAMGVFVMVLVAVIGSHFFGLRLNEAAKAKLSASDQTRQALQLLVADIRTAKSIRLGNGTRYSFVAITNGSALTGSAIQVYPGTNTNSFIRYYVDTNYGTLTRLRGGSETVVVDYLTNRTVFRAEDFQGNTLTNNQNNRVIGITLLCNRSLEFEDSRGRVQNGAKGARFDSYQLITKVTRRALE